MIIALTGTPGTGKTSVAKKLEDKGYRVTNLNQIISEKNFLEGYDEKRDSKIVDLKKLDNYVQKNKSLDDFWILDSHLSHLLKNVDKIFTLRCHPEELKRRLSKKNWKKNKIDENLEAEILDIILCEALEIHNSVDVFEIDTTNLKTKKVVEIIDKIIKNGCNPSYEYTPGTVDWSEELLKKK